MSQSNPRPEWTMTARERAVTAIREQGVNDAVAAVDGVLAEALPIHDFYGDMCATFCDFIKEELGEAGVEKAWRYLGERLWRPVYEHTVKTGGVEAMAGLYAMFLRSHRYKFRVDEDDDKITFHLDYCPSGQRLMQEGKLKGDNRHPLQHGVTEEPREWTFGKAGVPYYCGHTSLWFDVMPREWGLPVMSGRYGDFDAEGRVTGTPCQTFFWKKPRK
ncbi:MAG: hypothetical protein R3E77_16560 [Steroidobacteraceae bacterium]